MMMTDNPYTSPADKSSLTDALLDADEKIDRSLQTIARRTFLVWEKLRLLYITILGFVTLLLVAGGGNFNRRVLFLIIEGAIAANVAYFAGPVIETYVKWLGYNRNWPRWVLFSGGMLLSVILAVELLATGLLPDQD